MSFDYDQPDVPATAVADVVAEISSHGKLRELTDEEKQQRRIENKIYLSECRERDERQRLEHQRQQAEAAAIAAEQERERLRQEYRERSDREAKERTRQREIASLRLSAARQEVWQRNVEAAARNAVVQRQQQAVIDVLDRIVNPPPEPEPQIVVVSDEGSPDLGDRDFDPKAWMKKSRPWF